MRDRALHRYLKVSEKNGFHKCLHRRDVECLEFLDREESLK